MEYHLECQILEDADFDRLAVSQMGADEYSDDEKGRAFDNYAEGSLSERDVKDDRIRKYYGFRNCAYRRCPTVMQ